MAWRGSITANHRKWWAPAPRSVNFYDGAVVVGHGDSLHLKRFASGATKTRYDFATGARDDSLVAADLGNIQAQSNREQIDAARESTAEDLAAAHPENVLIPDDQLERVVARGVGSHVQITLYPADRKPIVLYCSGRGPALSKRIDVLKQMLGDRFSTEKITFS